VEGFGSRLVEGLGSRLVEGGEGTFCRLLEVAGNRPVVAGNLHVVAGNLPVGSLADHSLVGDNLLVVGMVSWQLPGGQDRYHPLGCNYQKQRYVT